jgi:hypothetical protein
VLTATTLAFTPAAVAAPAHDRVTGGGTIITNTDGDEVHVTVSAHKPADGDSTTGTGNVVIKLAGEPARHGTVECVAVSGNRAAVVAKLDGSETTYARIHIFDTGPGGEEPDTAQVKFNDTGFECSIPERFENPIKNGDFQVADN